MDNKSSSTNIKVAIRIRPFLAAEHEKKLCAHWATQSNVIFQVDETGVKYGEGYSFDHIFEMNKTNGDIYTDVVREFVNSSIEGLNSTIFAYGQTSSGKTYTMLGDRKDTGIMALAVEHIFQSIENNNCRKFLLRVSYMEIYNEKINDLLEPRNSDVKIREFPPSTITLQNIKEELVSTREQMYDCLKRGNLNRRIGSTQANARSSRSHTIFKIVIESTQITDFDNGGCVQVSNLNLVDLAGSERVAQTKATGVRLKEGGHINKSLSALSLVIKQLSDGQEYVNFRDSKLTRLLQDSLGGNSKTLIIATITVASIEDTASTLAFAQRAKTVKNKPQVNEILTDADVSKRYAALNTRLQKKLEEQMRVNQMTQEENERELTRLQQQIEMLQNFQGGCQTPESNPIPKRRHTIGFTTQKRLLPKFLEDNKSAQDLEANSALDLLLKHTCTPMLEPILEDELLSSSPHEMIFSSPTSHEPEETPPCRLRVRLSALEQDYKELVTFTRDEENIFSKTSQELNNVRQQLLESEAKVAELETTLKKTQRELTDYKNEDELAKFWEHKYKIREQELCSRIAELEETGPQERYFDTTNIMELLLTLQETLKSPDFDKEVRNDHNSVIEKFNQKVKTSKDIIENEILRQICTPDELEEKVLPNAIDSFNELLQELALFECDVPGDLINKVKKESIKDLKILIKIYEFLFRKNAMGRHCAERFTSLEAEYEKLKKEASVDCLKKESLSREIAEKRREIEELSKKMESSDTQELMRTKIENLNKVLEKHSSNEKKLNKEKEQIELKLNSLQQDEVFLKSENQELKTRIDLMKEDSDCLRKKLLEFTSTNSALNLEITALKNNVEKLSREITERDNLVEDAELLKAEITTLKNAIRENEQQLDQEREEWKLKFDNYEREKQALIAEIKNINFGPKLNSLQQDKVFLKSENQELKTRIDLMKEDSDCLRKKLLEFTSTNSALNLEITALKNNVEKLSREITKRDKLVEDAELLKAEITTLKNAIRENEQQLDQEREESKLKFDNYEREKQALIAEIENLKTVEAFLKKEVARLRIETCKLSSENGTLKREISTLKNKIEKLSRDINEHEDKNRELTRKLDSKFAEEEPLKAKVANLKNIIENLKQSKRELEELKLAQYEQEKKSLMAELEKLTPLKREITTLKNNAENLFLEIVEKNNCLNQEQARNAELERQLLEQKETNSTNEKKVSQSEHKLQQQKEMLNFANSRIDSLKQQVEEKEQYKMQASLAERKLQECVKYNEQLRLELLQSNCDNNSKKEESVLKDILCNITEHIINEEKMLLLIKHSQDKRDRFKHILKDLKSNQNALKHQIRLEDWNLNEIKENFTKSRELIHEYFIMEKSFLQEQMEQLERTNKEYLQEMMVLKEMKGACTQCDFLKTEIPHLKQTITSQQETIASLKMENTSRIKQVVKLREELYKEQDRKAEVAYSDFEKFCEEDYKSTLRRAKSLDKQVKELKERLNQKTGSSVQIQCDILTEDCILKENGNVIKEVRQINQNTSVEIQCNILTEESLLQVKYNQMKLVCGMRNEKISELKTEILELKQTITSQQETIASLRTENTSRIKEIVQLRQEIYKKQNRKTEVAYSAWEKFCEEDYKSTQQRAKSLEKQVKELKERLNQKTGSSVQIQSDILTEDCILKEKDNVMKEVRQINQNTSVEIQCNILTEESLLQVKYNQMKLVCGMRNEKISELKKEILRLKNMRAS